ncbi:LysR family transcriptional regulator [Janthinobacterium sp. HLX7-2]|uniref:LysR family transcriptional regulator n=1 Tax=Janthinobacterium sp. HLX7-2 TaxID=1259331 RepID=UPI003F20958F
MIEIESLSGITTFVVVARAASFTEAGELLGLSKSPIGKTIGRLEERLGVKLFYRATRHLTLTADGEAYFSVWPTALDG